MADPLEGPAEGAVGHGVGGLLELPEILREPRNGGRRVEDDLGPGQAKGPGALGEVAVVTDVDADLSHSRLEHPVAEGTGAEGELLPEAARAVREGGFPVFFEGRPLRVHDRARVLV